MEKVKRVWNGSNLIRTIVGIGSIVGGLFIAGNSLPGTFGYVGLGVMIVGGLINW
ncbi:MAG: hypothetical protein KAS32_19655 [Candidatus Peribacteraceae bacterium]|nr:hypothetical protein [Candidatus Peribacteraceae bacterium]